MQILTHFLFGCLYLSKKLYTHTLGNHLSKYRFCTIDFAGNAIKSPVFQLFVQNRLHKQIYHMKIFFLSPKHLYISWFLKDVFLKWYWYKDFAFTWAWDG